MRLFLLIVMVAIQALGKGQSAPRLSAADRVRLAEAFRLAQRVTAEVWPGWERTPMPVLLVTDSAEYLVGHPRPTPDFAPLGWDSVLGREVFARSRRFPPTLLATFPAIDATPTIVVGTAERTGKSSSEWVVTLLHEHFHQWQSSLPDYYGRAEALGLARGDTTGQWMLDYPFPYDSLPVQDAVKALAVSLARGDSRETVARQRQALRRRLSPDDDRYLEFQLWQEGVPRYVEIAAAEAAAGVGEPSEAFRRLRDYMPYAEVADRLRGQLDRRLTELTLARDRRVSFYSLGGALALLLERSDRTWKDRYRQDLFALSP